MSEGQKLLRELGLEAEETPSLVEELSLSPGGRDLFHPTARPLSATYVRDLTEADMSAPRGSTGTIPGIASLRSSHHALAKCLATGMKERDAALVTGYTATRISILKSDPTFMGLVESYQQDSKDIVADMTQRMVGISLDALELLQEKLNDHPEQFSIPLLLDTVKAFADRTGHGPNQEVNLRITPTDLIDRPPRETYDEWAKRRALELDPTDSLGSPTRTTN